MAYLFTIFNAFQGMFIFIFHCALQKKVKMYNMDESMEEWVVVLYQGSETVSIEGVICTHFPPNENPL